MANFITLLSVACIATLISAAPAPAAKPDPQILFDAPVLYQPAPILPPAPLVYSDFISPYAYGTLGYDYTYPYAAIL